MISKMLANATLASLNERTASNGAIIRVCSPTKTLLGPHSQTTWFDELHSDEMNTSTAQFAHTLLWSYMRNTSINIRAYPLSEYWQFSSPGDAKKAQGFNVEKLAS